LKKFECAAIARWQYYNADNFKTVFDCYIVLIFMYVYVFYISVHLNSKPLLRKLPKTPGASYLIMPHHVHLTVQYNLW